MREGVPGPGEIVAGKYRVERELAVGGMGAVLAVTEMGTGAPYAVKVMLPEALDLEGAITRFKREAEAARGLVSEHVVKIVEVGELPSGAPFMVMEHLEGKDLGDVTDEDHPLPVTEAVDYVLQVCAAMAEAHKAGIVHRDLKPSNLFLTRAPDGTPCVKVLDFGISKFSTGEQGKEDVSLTRTRAMMGSPLYMSPEQVRSAKNVDRRTDIWSLGVILYELLTARLPFEADSAGAVCAMIAADEPVPLRLMKEDLPAALEQVVMRCLVKEPAERYQDVSELAAELIPFASSLGRAAAGRAAATLEGAGAILPTLHGASIKLDLPARAAARTVTVDDEPVPPRRPRKPAASEADEEDRRVSTVPPPRRRGMNGWAFLLILGVLGWGGWHFRARLAATAAAYLPPETTAVAPTGEVPPPLLPPGAADAEVDAATSGAAVVVEAGSLADASSLDAGADADSEDAGEEEDEEEELEAGALEAGAGTDASALHAAAKVAPHATAPRHAPLKKKTRKKPLPRHK